MRKLSLAAVGLFVMMLSAFSQSTSTDSGSYKKRKLSFEEANIVSGYYHQNGNNSAVTGGIGTERLTDISNTFELKLKMYDKLERKHIFQAELGIDHYTSASSDKIDPSTISSASSADTRIYPSLNWTRENERKGSVIGAGLSFSSEFDYISYGANVNFSQKTRNKSGEFSAKLHAYLDQVSMITPIELRTNRNDDDYSWSGRNSFGAALSYSQIINRQLQIAFLLDAIYQNGYLGLPFHRIYFSNNVEDVENLPGTRFKLPVAFRANYFAGDKVIIRTFYRYYQDDWGLKAHTVNLELPVKLSSFVSISPFYRFYTQHGVDYFKPYKAHLASEQFFTSNYDLSTFNSHFFGAGVRFSPPENVFGIKHFSSLELRYGHYQKNIGMQSDIISLHLGFK